ncbi:MAG: AAA family ATPase [Clostridium sp.]
MERRFNSTGVCIPSMHYMVDISEKLQKIMTLIKRRDYFVINRPRQYGKTTTMFMLEQKLKEEYLVISLSFEGIGDDIFLKEESFSKVFVELMAESIEFADEDESKRLLSLAGQVENLRDLSKVISNFVKGSKKEVVLFIDEVDKSSNNQLFLSFLGMLRNKYLLRQQGKDKTFSSVILAGVYDVKNLKIKFRNEDEKKYNSPWNIAVNFDVDMSFNPIEIQSMLKEYISDKNVTMDIENMAKLLYEYTSGYPFLVSRLCQIIDENLIEEEVVWTEEALIKAMKLLLSESNTLADDLIKNIENNHDLKDYLFDLIMNGEEKTFNIYNEVINLGVVFGYLKNNNGKVAMANSIFEQILYNYFSSKLEDKMSMENYNFKENFVTSTGLDFKKILLRFQQFIKEQYSFIDSKFIEREGRLLFLAFIKPIINGVGFDFKEVQISEEKRLDIVITYLKEKYIVELKVWRGKEYHQKGLKQLSDYLDIKGLNTGYLVIYNFNKNKEYKYESIEVNGKQIFAIWV